MSAKVEFAELTSVIGKITKVQDFADPGISTITDVVTIMNAKQVRMLVPAYIIPDISMIQPLELEGMFVLCAKHGLLMHVQTSLYKPLKASMGKSAAARIKKITSHNGKLGFNFKAADGKYEVTPDTQTQFNTSKYPGFLGEAVAFHNKIKNNSYAAYLDEVSKGFTKNPTTAMDGGGGQLQVGDRGRRLVRGLTNQPTL